MSRSSTSGSSWERIPSDYDVISSSPPISDEIIDEKGFEHSGYENPDFNIFDEQHELPHAPLLDSWTRKMNLGIRENLSELVQKYFDDFGSSKVHKWLLILSVWAAISDAVEIVAVSYVIPHVQCEFGFSSFQLSVLTSIIFLGLLIGSFIWGTIGDQLGRRRALILSLSMNAAFGLLSSISNNFIQLILFRFGSGIGVGGSIPLIFAYISEISPSRRKGYYLSILASSWMLANVLTALLAYSILPLQTAFTSWRLFLVICTIPALTSTFLFIVCPESPLWLASNDEITKLTEVMKIFYPDQSLKELEYCQSTPIESVQPQRTNQKKAIDMYAKLFSHKYYRRSFLLALINFALSFSSYGISMWLPSVFAQIEKDPEASFCQSVMAESTTNDALCGSHDAGNRKQYLDSLYMALIQLPGNMATIMMLDWIGPKPILMLSLLFSAVTSLCLIYSDSAFESFIICCLYSLISVFSWNSLNVLNSYLFPVEIRSTATGMMNGANRIGGWLGSLSIGLFLAKGCGLSMLFLCFVILTGFCATMKLHMPRQLTVIK